MLILVYEDNLNTEYYYFKQDINLYVYDIYKALIMLGTNRINQSLLN